MNNVRLICAFVVVIAIGIYFLSTSPKSTEVIKQDRDTKIVTQKKKVLFVNSYHRGYDWSDGITEGILNVFGAHLNSDGEIDDAASKVNLKIYYMNAKTNKSAEYREAEALKVKNIIDEWKPDIVITSDDVAAKYLIAPYYINSKQAVVFCGVNVDATPYGFSRNNITGMVEDTWNLNLQVFEQLKKHAKGNRIGVLGADSLTRRKAAKSYKSKYKLDVDNRYAATFDDWKREFLSLQNDVDLLLIPSPAGITNWNKDEAVNFVLKNSKIPAGTSISTAMPYAIMGFTKMAQEQGEWAAKASLDILSGKSPKDIPIVTNKKAQIYLNIALAQKIGVKFPMKLIENAHLLNVKRKKLLYVDSYHKGYEWSDDLREGLLKSLDTKINSDGSYDFSHSKVEIKTYHMNTKLNVAEGFKKNAALAAKKIIEEWKPDVVVVSDDNAVKYLVVPYYMNSSTPFVFCGINSSLDAYGLPAPNITGMIEVAPYIETIAILRKFAKGERIGIVGVDTITSKHEVTRIRKLLKINDSDIKLISNYKEWEEEYLALQGSVDMLIWLNPIGIKNWDKKRAREYILKNTEIPTCGVSDNNASYVLLGKVKIASEQGWWAGKAALKILSGISPVDIPVASNKHSRLYLNTKLAEKLDIKFPKKLLKDATFVE